MQVYNLYSYVNYYGSVKYAIATPDAMPVNYKSILITSPDIQTLNEICDLKNNPAKYQTAIDEYNRIQNELADDL